MPTKSNAKKKEMKRVVRSQEEIERLMSKVVSIQAEGLTLTDALKRLNVPYNTHAKWRRKYGAKPVPAPVAEKEKTKGAQPAKPGIIRYTLEQKEDLRKEDRSLKSQGKTDKQVANALGIATGTLYKLRKSGKKVAVKETAQSAKSVIQLSPNNPIYPMALAHERLMQIREEILKLGKEKTALEQEMREMMEKAAEVCPGLKRMKK